MASREAAEVSILLRLSTPPRSLLPLGQRVGRQLPPIGEVEGHKGLAFAIKFPLCLNQQCLEAGARAREFILQTTQPLQVQEDSRTLQTAFHSGHQ